MDQRERGELIAIAVWKWVQEAKCVELVPWVSRKDSPDYDPVKSAEHRGWRRAIADLEELILSESRQLKGSG